LVVLGWLSLICWSGDLNSHQAFNGEVCCQELRLGGAEHPNEPLAWTIEPWLLTRLSGWVRENPSHPGFVAQTLPAADRLASAPEQDSQGRGEGTR
jgi:hypothetical protein